ncbi:MAG TPA: DUF1444 family protein [Symbiobacteriaceae bacterium]|nr:DUF1444 family protein [Symbiobacteriaceae bacterium]
MAKNLLNESQFCQTVALRARLERPDLRVEPMGEEFLLVEDPLGQRSLLHLNATYRAYCAAPDQEISLIESLLQNLPTGEPSADRSSWLENRARVMPQIVPASLLEHCKRDGRELVALNFVDELSIAFVLDEEERYAYLNRRVLEGWGVSERELLATAMENLQGYSPNGEGALVYQMGSDARLMFAWETFDGYDATRILLSRQLVQMAARVHGNPVIAIPHRDYLVLFGDADADFLAEMQDRIQHEFQENPYPVSDRLFTLQNGYISLYNGRRMRVLN